MYIPIKHADNFRGSNFKDSSFFDNAASNFNTMQMDFMNDDFNSPFPSSQNNSGPLSSSYIKRRQYTTSSTSSQGNNADNDIVVDNNEKFEVKIQVEKEYEPGDLNVKTVDGWIYVEGRQEKKGEGDNKAYSFRQFRRQYQMPHNIKAEMLKCSFKENTLIISAPKMVEGSKQQGK